MSKNYPNRVAMRNELHSAGFHWSTKCRQWASVSDTHGATYYPTIASAYDAIDRVRAEAEASAHYRRVIVPPTGDGWR